MKEDGELSYEALASTITGLAAPQDPAQRDVHWVTSVPGVGVSKTFAGRVEIFLACPQLNPSSAALRDAIDYQSWWRDRDSAPAFAANRLLLPEAEHYARVAAFLCAELLRNGAEDDVEVAFSRTEPIIELTLERLRLSDQSLFGLVGELLVLVSALENCDDADAAALARGWDGWRPSLRDFFWGTTGVEVKTTTGPTSTHTVAGTHQVEPDIAGGETGLQLVSIGLRPAPPHANTVSLPGLVDRILARLDTGAADVFLIHLREYGAASGFGYDHAEMREDPAFAVDFEIAFVRAYDMRDDNIAVLRSADVAAHQHVNPRSLRFAVQLPLIVTGDLNPVVGLHQAVRAILEG